MCVHLFKLLVFVQTIYFFSLMETEMRKNCWKFSHTLCEEIELDWRGHIIVMTNSTLVFIEFKVCVRVVISNWCHLVETIIMHTERGTQKDIDIDTDAQKHAIQTHVFQSGNYVTLYRRKLQMKSDWHIWKCIDIIGCFHCMSLSC